MTALTIYNLFISVSTAVQLFSQFPFSEFNVYRNLLCNFSHCVKHSWGMHAIDVFSAFALVCKLLIIFAEKIMHSFVITVCLILGLTFKGIVSEIEGTCNAKGKTLFAVVDSLMHRHVELEKQFCRLDSILSFTTVMRYGSDVLGLLSYKKQHIMANNFFAYAYLAQLIVDVTSRTLTFIYANEKAKEVIPVLEDVLIAETELSTGQCNRLTTHINRLKTNNIGMSLAKIVVVDRGFIATLVGVVLTYLLIMWQMDDGEFSAKKQLQLGALLQNSLKNYFAHRNYTIPS
ncbi:uncharacterized protein LOC129599122 [Paramacrobiotus metropolitanus]|uniref:uncharacterized protein LOC129599122 n=1 Tax=Paramacrobiotus metropolitanus TaxID=2943436 RepID=UPI00244561F2|nr:uncharacterized protein LOC129599122 [Paramacrobiotus metropolitanus]